MGKMEAVNKKAQWAEDLRKARALLGPFQCPWCYTDAGLQWTHKQSRLRHPTFGWIDQHNVRFYCLDPECKRTKEITLYGCVKVVDAYCKLFDEEYDGGTEKRTGRKYQDL